MAVGVLAAVACAGCSGETEPPIATVVKTDAGLSSDANSKDAGAETSADAAEDIADNKPPVAVDDLAQTTAGFATTIAVLDNDTDGDNDILKVKSVTQGQLGLVEIGPGGWSVIYTPLDAKSLGVDNFTYTVYDTAGATDTATVTVKINPPPTLVLTAPKDGEAVKGPDVSVQFKVTGCEFTSPGANADGCHGHKFLDGKKWKDAQGKGFGHYTTKGFTLTGVAAGKHTFKLVLIKNDGSDQPFEPEISDSLAFEVTSTTGG